MKTLWIIATFTLVTGVNAAHAEDQASPTANAHQSHAPPAAASASAPDSHRLSDLEAMTFDCPKAGLNAAAREAGKVQSQGTYQFSFFKIIHDAHHAFYEVHFKSNYQGEPQLKYCVSMYCQQGWDPRTSKTEVRLMSNEHQRGAAAHDASCGTHLGGKENRTR
jgi:hypothetical protein